MMFCRVEKWTFLLLANSFNDADPSENPLIQEGTKKIKNSGITGLTENHEVVQYSVEEIAKNLYVSIIYICFVCVYVNKIVK